MIVSIRLNLPKARNTLTLRYNTFEKVSYDKFVIASLISRTRDEESAMTIINALTGNGSLNNHFKKIYVEMKKLSAKEIASILKDSLYPIQKIEEHSYIYIPMLNVSIFQNQLFRNNIANIDYFAHQLVGQQGSYLDHKFSQNEPFTKIDNYEADLSESKIRIKVNKEFVDIADQDFNEIIVKDSINLEEYKGTIFQEIKGDNWIQLDQSTYNNLIAARDYYYDNGDHVAIYNETARRSRIAYSWGLIWIKESVYRYSDQSSQKICEEVANVLLKSGRINEFKTKTILDIMKNITRDKQQEMVDYILQRKDSKDIAKVGLLLISKGYEKGWSNDALNSFYTHKEGTTHLINIYKVNSNREFSIEDLLDIFKTDKTVLKENHISILNNYFSNCEERRTRIKLLLGEIAASGSREAEKSIEMDEDVKKFRKSANDYLGHLKKDVNQMNMNQLIQFEKKIENFFEQHKVVYQMIKKSRGDFIER